MNINDLRYRRSHKILKYCSSWLNGELKIMNKCHTEWEKHDQYCRICKKLKSIEYDFRLVAQEIYRVDQKNRTVFEIR